MSLLQDVSRAWEYENGFYLTCDITRVSKFIAHYELFKRSLDVPGEIVELGVFQGASLARFAAIRELLMSPFAKRIIAFDTFDTFPETAYDQDKPYRDRFIAEAGSDSISVENLTDALEHKGVARNVELVPGDITRTLPAYLAERPELRVSLINLDTDIYEPAKTALELLYPRLVPGGVLILDDYGTFPGETMAVDEYFGGTMRIQRFPFAGTPAFVVKEPLGDL